MSNEKLKVMLAGPYPKPGAMMGTYGRILNNIKDSNIFSDDIEFVPHRVTLPTDGGFAKRWIIDSYRFLRSMPKKPDVFHIIMQKYRALYREYPMLKIAQMLGIKTVVDIRAGTLQWMLSRKNASLQNAMMRSILRSCDAVVLECYKDVAFVKEHFDQEGLHLPNALLEKDFKKVKPANLKLQADQPIKLIYSGRYIEQKGIGIVLKSLDILSQRGIKAEFHLTGGGDDPKLMKLIKDYTQTPPPGTKVIDHGWDVGNLNDFMASHHVFTMPTWWPGEGHPNSVTEAMMAGLSMILSDWVHREDIVPEDGTIVVPPKDPGAMADAVETYVENSQMLIRAGKVNRQYVKDNYLDTVCYPRLLQKYQQLIQ